MVTGTTSNRTSAKIRMNAKKLIRITAHKTPLAKIPRVVSSAHVNQDTREMVSLASLPTVNIIFLDTYKNAICPEGLYCDVLMD